MADILDGHEHTLRQILEDAGQDPAGNALVPFRKLANVHFARFFILPPMRDPNDGQTYVASLFFLADVDGPAEPFIESLATLLGDGLHALFQHCRAYPGRHLLLDFLKRHTLPPAAKYVNTLGRTVEQIRREAELHTAIEQFLDSARAEWRDASARHVRARIQEFVENEPTLAWARRPQAPPEPA